MIVVDEKEREHGESSYRLSVPNNDAHILYVSKYRFDRLITYYAEEDRLSFKPLRDLGFLSLWCWELGVWLRVSRVDDNYLESVAEMAKTDPDAKKMLHSASSLVIPFAT